MEFIEVSAKTVEDALTDASVQLGITSDQLEYEIVEKGSSGFLGIGSKNAVIRVKVKSSIEDEVKKETKPTKEKEPWYISRAKRITDYYNW